MNNVHKWTDEQIEWIKQNHDKVTTKDAAIKLGVKTWTYKNKRIALGFRKERSHVNTIKMDLLNNVASEKIAYLLGFMWADGSLKPIYFKGKISSFGFYMGGAANDFKNLIPLMNELGEFGIRNVILKQTDCKRQPQIHFYSYDQVFCKFLYHFEYNVKSTVSPSKIISHLDKNLHSAFWHGFFDGDGSLSVDRKNYCSHLSFCGAGNQSWESLTEMLDELNVKWRLLNEEYTTKTGKVHTCSKIDLSLRSDIKIVMDYILKDSTVGLQRKRDKAIELEKWLEETKLFNHGKGLLGKSAKSIMRNDGKIYRSIRDAAKDIGCCPTSISSGMARKHKVRGFTFKFI